MRSTGKDYEIICGNCREELVDVVTRFPKSIIVTDPPFNVSYHYKTYKDNLPREEYLDLLGFVFSFSPFVLIHYPEEIYHVALHLKKLPDRIISWVYPSNTARQHRDIGFFGIKPDFKKYGQPYRNPKDKRIAKRIEEGKKARLYDWWEINQVKNVSKEKTTHPCQMPVEVMRRIIGVLPEEYIIIDPFMGSGTTGVACREMGRMFVGIDIDETYFNVAKERLENIP